LPTEVPRQLKEAFREIHSTYLNIYQPKYVTQTDLADESQ
jgi:hypothetical protein